MRDRRDPATPGSGPGPSLKVPIMEVAATILLSMEVAITALLNMVVMDTPVPTRVAASIAPITTAAAVTIALTLLPTHPDMDLPTRPDMDLPTRPDMEALRVFILNPIRLGATILTAMAFGIHTRCRDILMDLDTIPIHMDMATATEEVIGVICIAHTLFGGRWAETLGMVTVVVTPTTTTLDHRSIHTLVDTPIRQVITPIRTAAEITLRMAMAAAPGITMDTDIIPTVTKLCSKSRGLMQSAFFSPFRRPLRKL